MVDMQTRLKQRIQGRGIARALLEMATLDAEPADVQDGFWRELQDVMPKPIREPLPTAMTDDEAKAFEQCDIPFGKHMHEKYGMIPISYLGWVADQGIQLRRYMQSARAQRREE